MTSQPEPKKFQGQSVETTRIRATRFNDLCKSCGECIMKCPVNAISWHDTELGMLGEPAIFIDLDKCIGCETCERVCPDHAIEITNKRLESGTFSKGILGRVVKLNARVIELAVTTFRAGPARLKKFGKSEDRTFWCWLLRTFLRYPKEEVRDLQHRVIKETVQE